MRLQSTKTFVLELTEKEIDMLHEVVTQGKYMMEGNSQEEMFAKKLEEELERER